MSEIRLTPHQKLAVTARGTSILVSAAAGSGKTRVLTERLMSYVTDPENPRDIDSFLIITYTRAAAAELRSRILDELNRRVAEQPNNRRLRAQANLCYRAQIGTIHSFCTGIIRENAHLLGVTPDFRVLEEERAGSLQASVLERVLDDAYETIDTDTGFQSLVDTVGAGRDDQRLVRIMLALYGRIQSHAYPEDWAAQQAAAMDIPADTDVGDTPWGAFLLERARLDVQFWSDQMDTLLEQVFASETLERAYGASLEETAASLRDLCRALAAGWDAARDRLPVPFPRIKPLGKAATEADHAQADVVKARREACKKAMTALAEQMESSSHTLVADMARVRPAMEALLRLTMQFDAAYSREKRRQGVLDFSDLEHMAVRLLLDRETGSPTWLAVELSQRYIEIMVDEYQDVNAVQDQIFSAVSRQGRNLFMVGDVKQSIYRFRLADPGIFIGKYLRYRDAEEPGEEVPGALLLPEAEPRRILLQENFRSRPGVLAAANHVFENIMSAQLGEIDYDESARLRAGAAYPAEGEGPAELCLFALPETAEDEESPDKVLLEARAVASKICELVDSGASVTEGGVLRPIRYEDIVILLRSPGTAGPVFRRALEERGIPVTAEQGGGFFSSPEVAMVLSMLAIIHNPHQDVPLISVLRSPAVGFTADDLAAVRAKDKKGDFFTALETAAEHMPICRTFLDLLAELRALAPDLTADALVWHLYRRLDLLAVGRAMGDGETRRENLMQVFRLACRFQDSGGGGLLRFIQWINRLSEKGEEPGSGAVSGGAVRILSIHKSKGLEFPVVFLCDTARRFNRQDLTEHVLLHPELGLGPRVTDTERGMEYPTLARRAISRRLTLESLSEEMRVLYVAMTRARERLIITCAVKNPDVLVEKLRGDGTMPIPSQLLEGAQSMAHWLVRAALLPGGEQHMKLQIVYPVKEDVSEAESAALPDADPADCSDTADLGRRLNWQYSHSTETALPSKLTATELKGLPGESEGREESQELVKTRRSAFAMPELTPGRSHALTGAQKGTAAHLVMQLIDYAKTGNLSEIREEITRLEKGGWLTRQEAEAVDAEAIFRFFTSDTGRRILQADEVLREFKFSLLCPASDYFAGAGEDKILLQGVVDCCIREGNELTIIDYKTDYVNQNTYMERAESYAPQLRAYAVAMTRITGKPVREGLVYFLRTGQTVSLFPDTKNLH